MLGDSPSRPSTLGRPALQCPRGAENAQACGPNSNRGLFLQVHVMVGFLLQTIVSVLTSESH